MSQIAPYIKVLYFRNVDPSAFNGGYDRWENIVATVRGSLVWYLEEYSVSEKVDVSFIAEEIAEEMYANAALTRIDDDFAGSYYCVERGRLDAYKKIAVANNAISHRADILGEQRYYSDVFSGYKSGEIIDGSGGALSIAVPASNRVVTVDHNQRAEVVQPLDALILDVQGDNEQIEEGVKERLLGQMRAGRELIQSGSVKAYLLYHTLVRGLLELMARYRGRAIAVAAEKLIELLVENFFKSADS